MRLVVRMPRITVEQMTDFGCAVLRSLCPANETLTEACFRKTTLPFVGDSHKIRRLDNSSLPDPEYTMLVLSPMSRMSYLVDISNQLCLVGMSRRVCSLKLFDFRLQPGHAGQ